MWVWGIVIGFVVFVAGAVFSILTWWDGYGLEAMLPGIVLAALGSVMVGGFLVWGLAYRRGISE
jgi:hypothetical protein